MDDQFLPGFTTGLFRVPATGGGRRSFKLLDGTRACLKPASPAFSCSLSPHVSLPSRAKGCFWINLDAFGVSRRGATQLSPGEFAMYYDIYGTRGWRPGNQRAS